MSDTKTPVHPLLEGTTPGPWLSTQVADSLGPMVGTYEVYNRPFGMGVIGWALTAKDADLFSAAPTLAAENARLRAALERAVSEIRAMRHDEAMKWTNDFDKAVSHADSSVSDYREVLASLTT